LFRDSGGELARGHHGSEVTKTFASFAIRIVTIDGNPWFVAADVCKALGLWGYPSQHTAKLAADQRMVVGRNSHVLSTRDEAAVFTPKAPTITIISESGLYKLALRSDKKEAEAFQDWVTRDVLPAIRKDGGYILGEEAA